MMTIQAPRRRPPRPFPQDRHRSRAGRGAARVPRDGGRTQDAGRDDARASHPRRAHRDGQRGSGEGPRPRCGLGIASWRAFYRTCATRAACCARRRASPRSRCSRSRSASAPTRRSSPSSTRSCSRLSRSRTPRNSSSSTSSQRAERNRISPIRCSSGSATTWTPSRACSRRRTASRAWTSADPAPAADPKRPGYSSSPVSSFRCWACGR